MFTRFAIYFTPAPGALAAFGARWLGWDATDARPTVHPEIEGLPQTVAEMTEMPRKYGLHGTLKAPFRLATGKNAEALAAATGALAARLAPIDLGRLELRRIGRFLALTPANDQAALTELAAEVVEDLDPFRATATAEELARRRKAHLTPMQDAMLRNWGYPYTHDEFRFHITLTGSLPDDDAERTRRALLPVLGPLLSVPQTLDALTLMGEAPDGRFQQIHRYALTG